MKEQEYDLLDIDGDFYNDICTPFSSDKDTDVILNDRIKYYYSKVSSDATCPQKCDLLKYISQNNKLKCVCEVRTDSINTEESSDLLSYPITNYDNHLNDYKYSSYKTMKCSNLVFNSKIFAKNAGSILMLLFFIGYLVCVGFYIFKKISPLKVSISQILSNNSINNTYNLFDIQSKSIKKNKKENKKENKSKESKDKNGKEKNNNKKSFPPKKIQINNKSKPKKLMLRSKEEQNINLNDNNIINKKKCYY